MRITENAGFVYFFVLQRYDTFYIQMVKFQGLVQLVFNNRLTVENHRHQYIPDHSECRLVDVVQVVFGRVPVRDEAAFVAVNKMYEVDHRDAGEMVHIDVVVVDGLP